MYVLICMLFPQVVNRLRKEYVYETLRDYGVQYDKTWIYDKIHHEINQFCSSHSLQQVYIDVFDQVTTNLNISLQITVCCLITLTCIFHAIPQC